MTDPYAAGGAIDPATACAEIDLAAFRANVTALAAHVAPTRLMVVVKADGYGHGMLACAREARIAGAHWLGAATPAEALLLRESGDTGPLLTWLYGVGEDLAPLVAAEVDVSVQSLDQLSRVVAAAATTEQRARVHLKVDTGLARNGCPPALWPELCAEAAEAEDTGAVQVVGVWSHLAAADEPGHPATPHQLAAFTAAYAQARVAGLEPSLRHLGNSAGALVLPEAHFDLVRVGIAAYGIDPAPGLAARAGVTLRPAMRLRAELAAVRPLATGAGVSYGWTWTADRDTVVGLVPLGYADGIPRHASNRAEVAVPPRSGSGSPQRVPDRAPVRGRVCMDQFVVDLGPGSRAEPGDEVVLFGAGAEGEPTAEDWAAWCDTIGYEVVTRIGARVPRRYLNASQVR
ncbi:MAG: alr [Friedmanniella sp.]|nr:alr [Friedmanniella sp.]